jgi:soluble lytic murein transglycosylase-like protein
MDLNSELLNAMIEVESNNDPKAFNEAQGARGLTQITPIAWDDLVAHYPDQYKDLNYERDIWKPEIAIKAGNDYIKLVQQYLKTYKMPINVENIVSAYNWGIGNTKKFGVHNAPAETKAYIAKVRHLLQPQAEQMDENIK